MSKGDDIEERLVNFAVRIITVCTNLPKTPEAKHIGGQILRSGTSPAANYTEARSAESDNDFVHKLKICLKELNETRVWLKITHKSEIFTEAKLKNLLQENEELCRIIGASIKTVLAKEEKTDLNNTTE